MSSSLADLPLFSVQPAAQHAQNHLVLQSAEGYLAHIFILEEDVLRLVLLPNGTFNFPTTWAIAPGADDVAQEGRERFDLTGFSLPAYQLHDSAEELTISTTQLKLSITKKGLFCHWQQFNQGAWHSVASDRPTQSYNFNWWDEKIYHYLKRDSDELYFGLGERAGESNRAGQRYRLRNLDPMGYSARSSDPLYKHIPFYITWKKSSQSAFGLFYDTLADGYFDFGKEIDNYHGPYRSFVADYGDLDLYFIGGPKPADVTRRFTWLTGRPAFTPKWSLAYSGSTMTYTDAPNAQEQMNEFLAKCKTHDIACQSFHLSSGYTSIAGKRYVFNWNRDKFPDPAAFAQHYLNHGVRLCANIKPCLLRDHPRFGEAENAGLFIKEPDGRPAQVQYWDETGALLDFSNPQTYNWWKTNVTEALLNYGITATWNDNNEFGIWSTTPVIHGFGTPRAACQARGMHTLLMIKASHEAQCAHAPQKRPYLVSRSGVVGMQRYVQTWSGDNYTAWETLRYNIKMAMGLALSGVSNTGHDIGGFSGPAPDPELFVRWVQHGIFLPRFSIHSWNDDQSVNEPWMYPQVTPYIRALIRLRSRLTPYMYDLVWRSHRAYEPIIRPSLYDFPHDANCFVENDDMLLGRHLLVASVVEAGQSARTVYLPQGANWFDYWSGEKFAGGQTISLPAPWDQPPLLVRENAILALNTATAHFAQNDDQRGFALFIATETKLSDTIFEDDGESTACYHGEYGEWQFTVHATPSTLNITLLRAGKTPPTQQEITLFFPRQDTRALTINGAKVLSECIGEMWREVVLGFAS